jgi:hypothetical protein
MFDVVYLRPKGQSATSFKCFATRARALTGGCSIITGWKLTYLFNSAFSIHPIHSGLVSLILPTEQLLTHELAHTTVIYSSNPVVL